MQGLVLVYELLLVFQLFLLIACLLSRTVLLVYMFYEVLIMLLIGFRA